MPLPSFFFFPGRNCLARPTTEGESTLGDLCSGAAHLQTESWRLSIILSWYFYRYNVFFHAVCKFPFRNFVSQQSYSINLYTWVEKRKTPARLGPGSSILTTRPPRLTNYIVLIEHSGILPPTFAFWYQVPPAFYSTEMRLLNRERADNAIKVSESFYHLTWCSKQYFILEYPNTFA